MDIMIENFGLAFMAARKRAEELRQQGHRRVEYFPCYPEEGEEPHWRVSYYRTAVRN